MSRVLVTGGAGFIGSAMVNRLLNQGLHVVCFDLPERARRHSPTREAEIYEGDVLSVDSVAKAARGCDYVVHLAAVLGVQRTETHRLECLEVTIQGTRSVLEACMKNGVKKIIFSSSSDVYGEQTKIPISEDNPLNASSVYAISKLAAEEYVKAYAKHYDLDYCILRFFNVYGPEQSLDFVVPKFVYMSLNNTPPTIYGDGQQVRSFCHVDDVVGGVILAMLSENANSQTINIGNDKEPVSMADLARKVISLAGKDLEPEFVPQEASDREKGREISIKIPDISKARAILGYEPTVSLSEGILRSIQYWSTRL